MGENGCFVEKVRYCTRPLPASLAVTSFFFCEKLSVGRKDRHTVPPCLQDDLFLFMATPAWPTPMRALISKFNSLHVPECITGCGLFNRPARRFFASIPTSSIPFSTRIF